MDVLAEVPRKRPLRKRSVLGIPGCTERLKIKFDSAGDIDRLLIVERSFLALVEPTVIADWLKDAVHKGYVRKKRCGFKADFEKALILGRPVRRQ